MHTSTAQRIRAERPLVDQTTREERRAKVQPVCQIVMRLKPRPNGDRFHETVREILRWMNNRAGSKLPIEAWSLKSFEMNEIGEQRTAAVGLTDPPYWAARLDDADRAVARRVWSTEIGVGLDHNLDVIFGTRLLCVTRGENPPYIPSVPGFVKFVLASGMCELDGELADGIPRTVSTEQEVDWLVTLLEHKNRAGDVIVLSQQEEDGNPSSTALDAHKLANALQGIAHVVILTSKASYLLTDRVGKELSVYRQAVRTYRPGFRSWLDDPLRHHLAIAPRIRNWEDGGPNGFESSLRAHSTLNTAYAGRREDILPSFTSVRQIAARLDRERAKRHGASETELLQMYESEIEQLESDLQEQKETFEELLIEAERERAKATEKANEATALMMHARARIDSLAERLIKAAGQSASLELPGDLGEFENWCTEQLTGAVIINNRAFQGIKKSVLEDVALIYKALLLLRDYYVPMRVHGGAERQQAYEQALNGLHIVESPTGDGAKSEDDEYTIQYKGKRQALDRHLKSGNSRDPRFCFRLYFLWDEELQMVVVGWLPSHLENRLT
jgi:hypothetical protein